MNYQVLQNRIERVVNKILSSIVDPDLKKLVEEKAFLTGGCFKAIWHGEKVNDYDFYFMDRESADKFKELITKGLEKPETTPFTNQDQLKLFGFNSPFNTSKSEFAITFMLEEEFKVQFITKYVGTPEVVTGRFDFLHTQNYYVLKHSVFKVNYPVLQAKELVFNEKATHPVHALKRLKKFLAQGWTIEDSEIIKMAEAINKLDMDTFGNWKEQTAAMYSDYQQNGIVIFNNNIATEKTKQNLIKWVD